MTSFPPLTLILSPLLSAENRNPLVCFLFSFSFNGPNSKPSQNRHASSSPPLPRSFPLLQHSWQISDGYRKGNWSNRWVRGGGTGLEPSKGGSKAAESKNKGREGSSCWTLWFWIPIIWFKNYNPRFRAFVVLFRSGLVVVNFGSLQFQFVENLEINFSNSISVLKGSNEVQHFLLFACSPLFRFTSVFSSVSIQPGRRRFQSLITARCCSRNSFSVWFSKLPFGALKSLSVFQLCLLVNSLSQRW